MRLWLIFGEWEVAIELPITLLAILLKLLRGAIATLGAGCGKALLGVGRYLRGFLETGAGGTKSS